MLSDGKLWVLPQFYRDPNENVGIDNAQIYIAGVV